MLESFLFVLKNFQIDVPERMQGIFAFAEDLSHVADHNKRSFCHFYTSIGQNAGCFGKKNDTDTEHGHKTCSHEIAR